MNNQLKEDCRAHLEKRIMLELSGTTPKAFLLSVLANNNIELKHRMDAAKALLPYTEAKVVEERNDKPTNISININRGSPSKP